MSTMTRYYDIMCDGGCSQWECSSCTTLKGARKVMKSRGWKTRKVDGRVEDICPKCQTDSDYQLAHTLTKDNQ